MIVIVKVLTSSSKLINVGDSPVSTSDGQIGTPRLLAVF
jgi:hypothetical protein